MIPIAGSAYTYTYATLGELVAWIIGWDLILEYAVSNMAVAVGFSAYINSLLDSFGIHIPAVLSTPAYSPDTGWAPHFNIMGFLVVMFLTVLLVFGIRESAGANNIMVGIKLLAIVVFCIAASKYIQPANWHPFFPNHMQGVLTGGAIVFFTYIGFDSVSTAAEECKDPKRDLPIGILVSLFVCSFLYIAVALVLTGIQHWNTLEHRRPRRAKPSKPSASMASIAGSLPGRLMGMISSILVFQLGQARVWFAMSRDGLLPAAFSRVHRKFRTPDVATWVAGFFVAIPAGIFDIGTLADLSNIGTLFAFILVSIAVLILRKRQPDRPRGFRVPWTPLDPHRLGGLLLHPDGQPDRRKLAPIFRLAPDRSVRLPFLRPQAQRTQLPRTAGTPSGGDSEPRTAANNGAGNGAQPALAFRAARDGFLPGSPVFLRLGRKRRPPHRQQSRRHAARGNAAVLRGQPPISSSSTSPTPSPRTKTRTSDNGFIRLDHYGQFPFSALPHDYTAAVGKFTRRTVEMYGLLPWQIGIYSKKLTDAFQAHNWTEAKALRRHARLLRRRRSRSVQHHR